MFNIEKARSKGIDERSIEIMEEINENERRRESCTKHDFDVTKIAVKYKCNNCGCKESVEYIKGYLDGLKHAAGGAGVEADNG